MASFPSFQGAGPYAAGAKPKRPVSGTKARPISANRAIKAPAKSAAAENADDPIYMNMSREELEIALRASKSKVKGLEASLNQLRTENQRWEAEVKQQQRRLEKFLEPGSNSGKGMPSAEIRRELEKSLLVRQLKTQIMLLRGTVTEREIEIENLKRSLKGSKLAELSNEKEEFYLETLRLKQVVKELRDTLHLERQRRIFEKKRGTNVSDELRKEVAKLTSGYQNILKGMPPGAPGASASAAGGGGAQSASGKPARPVSAHPHAGGAGVGGSAKRPQSASKGGHGHGGGRSDGAGASKGRNFTAIEEQDELEYFAGNRTNDGDHLALGMGAGTSGHDGHSVSFSRETSFQKEASGHGDPNDPENKAKLKRESSVGDDLIPEMVEIFASKITARDLKHPQEIDRNVHFSIVLEDTKGVYWTFDNMYNWSPKASSVFTLGRTTILEDGVYKDIKNSEMKFTCPYKYFRRSVIKVIASEKPVPVNEYDDEEKPAIVEIASGHSYITLLPDSLASHHDLPLEVDVEIPLLHLIKGERRRVCTVTVSLELRPVDFHSIVAATHVPAKASAPTSGSAVDVREDEDYGDNGREQVGMVVSEPFEDETPQVRPPERKPSVPKPQQKPVVEAVKAVEFPFKAGDRVEGNYMGENSWYSATVKSVNKEDGVCHLMYDDGDEERAVPVDRIRLVAAAAAAPEPPVVTAAEASAAGRTVARSPEKAQARIASNKKKFTYAIDDRIEALFEHGTEWYPATVKKVKDVRPDENEKYYVVYDDGDNEDDMTVSRMRPMGGSASKPMVGDEDGQDSGFRPIQPGETGAPSGDSPKKHPTTVTTTDLDSFLDGLSDDDGDLSAGPAMYGNVVQAKASANGRPSSAPKGRGGSGGGAGGGGETPSSAPYGEDGDEDAQNAEYEEDFDA